MSLDNRYQAVDDPIAEHMLEPHLNLFNSLQWEDVYRDWESDELQYYWKDHDLTVLPRDFSYGNKGFEEALELARGGDDRAVLHLNRVVKRDPTAELAQRAVAGLAGSWYRGCRLKRETLPWLIAISP